MRFSPTFLAALCFTPALLFAEANQIPEVPTRMEADATIAAEMQARELREADRKASIEAVSAFEEWEVDRGKKTVGDRAHAHGRLVLRRVAPPKTSAIMHQDETTGETITEPEWTEEQIAAWMAEQPVARNLNLTAVVFDHTFTEITWRDEKHREWTILSNIDFRYLRGIGHFEDESHYWMTFFFVYEVNSEEALDDRMLNTTHTLEHWLTVMPEDFLNSTKPEFLIFADDEKSEIPDALYEELDALHRHYHAHEKRLIAEYERNKVMNEARRAWHEANPPEPKDTVINFWKVR